MIVDGASIKYAIYKKFPLVSNRAKFVPNRIAIFASFDAILISFERQLIVVIVEKFH